MNSDKCVLKAMQRRLAKTIGQGMADALGAKAHGEQEKAKGLEGINQRLGIELQRLDDMLTFRLAETPTKQPKWDDSIGYLASREEAMEALMEHIPTLGGPAEQKLCLEVQYMLFENPHTPNLGDAVAVLNKHPWPAEPKELRHQAGLVVSWLKQQLKPSS